MNGGKRVHDHAALLALCAEVLPEDPSLVEEVRLAIQQPAVYWATIQPRQRLQLSSESPPPELPWLALLNGLLARGHLDLLDWRASLEEMMAAVDGLLRSRPPDPRRWAWVDEATWAQATTDQFLAVVGDYLLAQSLVLTFFPLDADMYPLAVIEQERLPALQRLAALTGYGDIEPF
jgi:hypothetical protein